MAEVDDNEKDINQGRNLTERIALNNAYSALLGQQYVQSFSAVTFEEVVDLQLEQIEGKSTARRPNQLERVDRIEGELKRAVAVLKETPPERFMQERGETDV